MFFHPAIELEIARQLQQDRLARAERHRSAQARSANRRETDMHRVRNLPALLRRVLGSRELPSYHLELHGPILIRHSRAGDEAALERLAALNSLKLPEGSFLLAEINGELVAAAPIDVDAEPLGDPFRPTANIRQLLRLQAGHARRHRDAHASSARGGLRALRETA